MKIAIIGPGKLGSELFQSSQEQRLVIGRSKPKQGAFYEKAELGYSNHIESAVDCELIAVALPHDVSEQVFDTLCPLLPDGRIVLNFSTKWNIPQRIREQFPQLHLVEAKLLGSAIGMSQGLKGLVLLGSEQENIIQQIQACFSGLNMMVGNYTLVNAINTAATKAALKAAFSFEKELLEQGIVPEYINIAIKGLMPGVLIAYAEDKLGEFSQSIVNELKHPVS